MDTEMLDQLLLMWRDEYDAMQGETEWIRDQISTLSEELEMACAPFKEVMRRLEEEIKGIGFELARSYTEIPTVEMSYRKGYTRVSYDSKQTDMVLGFLRDVLPDTAKQLEKARKESAVAPSVSVKAKEVT